MRYSLAGHTGTPYIGMRTVVETPSYLSAARDARLDETERAAIVTCVASNPSTGDLLVGGAGLRKFRWGRGNAGKSGGVRVITFFSGEEKPVFLVALFAKNEKSNLTPAEVGTLAKRLRHMAALYGERDD